MAVTSEKHGSREEILGRVRAALKKSVPRCGNAAAGPIFPPVANAIEQFQAECAANYTEVMLTPGSAETAAALHHVIASLPTGELFAQDAPELRRLVPVAAGERPVRWSGEGAPRESSQATITLCEALVAMTGSILVSSSGGGRGASAVAPCHIVVARAEQLVSDLEAALERAKQIAFAGSFVGLITGCSRTSDIEKKLVIGAHGPRRLVVLLQTGE